MAKEKFSEFQIIYKFFDALQLLQTILDPSKFDQTLASNMLDRWARRLGQDHWRETSLAVEFPYELEENCEDTLGDFWREEDNWPGGVVKKRAPIFWFDLTYDEDVINVIDHLDKLRVSTG